MPSQWHDDDVAKSLQLYNNCYVTSSFTFPRALLLPLSYSLTLSRQDEGEHISWILYELTEPSISVLRRVVPLHPPGCSSCPRRQGAGWTGGAGPRPAGELRQFLPSGGQFPVGL